MFWSIGLSVEGEAAAFARRDGLRFFRSAKARRTMAWLSALLIPLIVTSFFFNNWTVAAGWVILSGLVFFFVQHRLRAVRAMRVMAESRARLSQQVDERTQELTRTLQYLDLALRGLDVTVFSQDRDLRFTYMSTPRLKFQLCQNPIGRTDADILTSELAQRLTDFKRNVLSEAKAAQMEFRVACVEKGECWFRIWAEPSRNEHGQVIGLVGAITDVTERRQRETHNRILLRELTHRTKNLLSVIQAMARQTLTDARSAQDFEARFSARLLGLARSLDLLVAENWGGASINDLFRSQLGHFAEFIGSRIKLAGPALKLTPEAAQNLGLALHELATNSAKYGALSAETGDVVVHWRIDQGEAGDMLCLEWRERGGPIVVSARRKGFGHAVIEKLVPRALGGTGEVLLAQEGLIWTLRAPLLPLIANETED